MCRARRPAGALSDRASAWSGHGREERRPGVCAYNAKATDQRGEAGRVHVLWVCGMRWDCGHAARVGNREPRLALHRNNLSLCLGEAFATKQYHACAECSHNDKAAGVTIERASEEEYGARHDEAAQ